MSTPPANWDARKGGMVRKRRQALNWEQRELAERVGVHVNSVQRWEAGRQYPGRKLGKLEAVLGISLDDTAAPPPAVPKSLVRDVMDNPELSDSEREAVLAAIERQLVRERGGAAASSPEPSAEPERRRPAS